MTTDEDLPKELLDLIDVSSKIAAKRNAKTSKLAALQKLNQDNMGCSLSNQVADIDQKFGSSFDLTADLERLNRALIDLKLSSYLKNLKSGSK